MLVTEPFPLVRVVFLVENVLPFFVAIFPPCDLYFILDGIGDTFKNLDEPLDLHEDLCERLDEVFHLPCVDEPHQ